MQTLSNKRAVMPVEQKLNTLFSGLKTYLSEEQIHEVELAFTYVSSKISDDKNQNLNDAISIAKLLSSLKLDSHSICAALLRCIGKEINFDEIEKSFGSEIATLLNGVSKIGEINDGSLDQAEAESYRRMLMAVSQDIRVIIIELADCLHRTRCLGEIPQQKTRAYIARNSLDIFAPIASRLGLYDWSKELKELCFEHLFPKRFKALTDAVKKRDGNRKEKVNKLQDAIQSFIDDAAVKGRVLGRKKNVYSIYQKMLKKKLSFEDLKDIYGFRVIVDSVDDCYRSLGIIHSSYKPIPGKFSDYIAIPKENGYQSLHTIVISPFGDMIEVQIRTENMHEIAESGVAAHWLYKTNEGSTVNSDNSARQWLIDLLDPNHNTSNPTEFLEYLKMDLYSDEVYVFTPKGDIKRLPKGATALDFAYAVHTDVGSKCSSVKINGQTEHVSKVVNNGDQIEIVLNSNTSPNLAWLSYASTARARSKIKSALQDQNDSDALRIGKRLLDHAIETRGFEKRHISQEQKTTTLNVLGIESWDDLLIEIGKGNRIPNLVARQIFTDVEASNTFNNSNDAILVRGTEGMLVTYSRCCCPIPGDPIIGVFTSGHGLVVHTTDCPNTAAHSKQPDKCTPVAWGNDISEDFPVKLRVWAKNKRATIARITSVIAENNCNINNIEVAESTDKIVHIDFTFDVKDRVHFAQVIKQLRALNRVTKVARQKG